jgi:hypothetical protein
MAIEKKKLKNHLIFSTFSTLAIDSQQPKKGTESAVISLPNTTQ